MGKGMPTRRAGQGELHTARAPEDGEGDGDGTALAPDETGGDDNGGRTELQTGKRQTLYDICVFCVGTKPYLANRYETEKMIQDLIFGGSGVRDRETPLPGRANWTIFRDTEGKIIEPTEQIMSCLCEGGCKVQLKGRTNLSSQGGKESLVPSFLDILDGEHIPLLMPDGRQAKGKPEDMDKDWKVDVRRGALKDGTPCAIVRARFDQWAFLLHVRVDLSVVPGLTLGHVRKLFEMSGKTRGLGGFRRSFGRFTIAEGGWLVTEVDESQIVRPKAPMSLMQAPDGVEVVTTA